MIVFDLECRERGHRFEGWFASSDDFARQQDTGLLACPQCGSTEVRKAPMAPNLGRKGNQIDTASAASPQPVSGANAVQANRIADHVPTGNVTNGNLPPEAVQMMITLARMQEEALKTSRWVGDRFAEQSRAMHYGETETESIHGQATLAEAKELLEEGIELAPLPFPVVPPEQAN